MVYEVDENGIHRDYELDEPNLRFLGNALRTEKQGYKCGHITFDLTDSNSKKQVSLRLGDFMFFAFQNNINTAQVNRLECRHEPGSSIIPMVVGGALLGLAAVVVIAYFIMRKKPSNSEKE